MLDDRPLAVLRAFVTFDLVAAVIASVGVAIAAIALDEPRLMFVAGAVALLGVLLVTARRSIANGRVADAIVRVALGNWIVAIVVVLVLPFLWPTMVLTVLLPLVLAAPYVERSNILLLIVCSTVLTGVVVVVGSTVDTVGRLADLDESIRQAVSMGTVVALIVPIGLIVTQTNRLQRAALDRSQLLNEQLRGSQEELERSRRRVVDAADGERIRIERDLHDGAQQRLVALGMRLRLLASRGAAADVADAVAPLVDEVDLAIDELRELARGIYPPILETRGLSAALGAVARRSTVTVRTSLSDVGRFDPAIEAAAYFAGLEALTNTAKHASDAAVTMALTFDGEHVSLVVSDDGPGFVLDQRPSGGLLNMGDRVSTAGGTCEVDAHPGVGTTVTIRLPGRSR